MHATKCHCMPTLPIHANADTANTDMPIHANTDESTPSNRRTKPPEDDICTFASDFLPAQERKDFPYNVMMEKIVVGVWVAKGVVVCVFLEQIVLFFRIPDRS
jgi:hypothetical protein